MGIIIKSIEYKLPENSEDISDLAEEFTPWKIDEIYEKTGVKKRYIAKKDETALDLTLIACSKILKIHPRETIDGIIFCTQSPDYIIPANSFLLHKELNLRNDIFNFDFNHACSGYIYSLIFAEAFLSQKIAKKILLINADTYSKYIAPHDRSTRSLFGDASAVSVIQYENNNSGIIDYSFHTDGSDYKSFWIPNGGSRNPLKQDGKTVNPEIEMNGMNVWSFINAIVPKQIDNLLKKNGLSHKDIDHYIFHQSSLLSINSLIKIMNLDKNKVTINLNEVGNTVSASIPIALKSAIKSKNIKEGSKVVLAGFGAGLSAAVVIMQF